MSHKPLWLRSAITIVFRIRDTIHHWTQEIESWTGELYLGCHSICLCLVAM
ncbi:hypothetical protein M5D96_010290, partial [Drosophila gunungcola]